MLNNFIYAQTKDLFLEQLNAGNILDEAIVFIEDTKEIWNHGAYFAGEGDHSLDNIYITDFTIDDLHDVINNETSKTIDTASLFAAVQAGKIIVVPIVSDSKSGCIANVDTQDERIMLLLYYFSTRIELSLSSTSTEIKVEDVWMGDMQDKITDLDTIRSGAAKGATALQSYTEKYTGTVTGVKVNGVTKNPSNGVVDLGEMLTEDKLGDFVKDDEILELLEDIYAYGIKFYSTTDSYGSIVPNFSKIGNATLLANKPIHKKMRGCVLNNNGQVVRYLPEDDWSDEYVGANANVMVEVPQHYRRFFYTYDGHYGILISERPLRGFHLVPKFYVGAYLGSKNTNNELVSSSSNGEKIVLANRSDCRNYARTNRDNRWNIMTYEMFKSLWWLYAIDEPNTFIGGGWGQSTRYPNEYFEDHSWLDPSYDVWGCNGVTSYLGNTTGIRSYETEVTHWVEDDYGEGDYVTETVSVTVFRWRGIENFLSTFLEWIDGVNIKVNPQGGENTSQVYVCYDPSRFTDNSYDGYNYVGDLLRETEASFDKFIFGENGEPLPAKDSPLGKTPWDGYDMCNLTKVDNTTSELRGLSFNGFLSSVHKPSESPNCVTARLCFTPNE